MIQALNTPDAPKWMGQVVAETRAPVGLLSEGRFCQSGRCKSCHSPGSATPRSVEPSR